MTGLKVKKSSVMAAEKWVRHGIAACLLTAACGVSHAALAQSQNQNFNQQKSTTTTTTTTVQEAQPISGGKQLPSGFADAQVPPSFAQDDGQPAAKQSDQIITPKDPAKSSDTKTTTTTTTTKDSAVKEEATNAPAQPEGEKLVKATQMGTTTTTTTTSEKPNPVEDAAAAADAAMADQAGEPEAEDNVLAKYKKEATNTPADNDSGDALPPSVNTTTMVKLQGDFPNSNKNVSVAVDGDMSKAQTPEDKKRLQESIRQEAFDAAITGMFPLTPDQIKTLLGKYDQTQKAVDTPPYDAPKPEITVQNISLDPGVVPPTIKTAVGNVTTINILDATGAPWPVQDVTWAGDFEVVEPEQGGHIIRITPMAQFAHGNIVVRLLTLKTPITLTLETSRDVVQYRVDARVPEYGPFASAPLMQGGKSMVAGDSTLTGLLDGVAPAGATKLDVSGVDGRTTAYNIGGSTYVRTPLTLLSPAWQSSVSSADGMNVYVLSSAPVLLLSDEGEFMRATLKEKEDLLDE